MRLAVYRSAATTQRLRDIVGDTHIPEMYEDRRALKLAIRTRPLDALMLDPSTCMDDPGVCSLVARYESLPLILYPALARDSILTFLAVNRIRASTLLIRDIEDSPDRLRDFLRSVPPANLNRAIISGLSASIATLPRELGAAITLHFVQAEPGRSVEWLAATGAMTRRSVDRWIRKAGLSSARLLTMAPVLTRAFVWLRDPGYRSGDVAAKIGVSSRHTLAEEFQAVLGIGSLGTIRDLTPASFVDATMSVLQCEPRKNY